MRQKQKWNYYKRMIDNIYAYKNILKYYNVRTDAFNITGVWKPDKIGIYDDG